MKQVSKTEFFAVLYKETRNIHPQIQPGPYPYTSIWKDQRNPGAAPFGKSVGRLENPGKEVTDYFLN